MSEPAESAAGTVAGIFVQAHSALELISESCVLVLDPTGSEGLNREFIQQHASTSRQLRILKAQLLLNGARDFLSRLFPGLGEADSTERDTRASQARSAGSTSSASRPEALPGDSLSDSWP